MFEIQGVYSPMIDGAVHQSDDKKYLRAARRKDSIVLTSVSIR